MRGGPSSSECSVASPLASMFVSGCSVALPLEHMLSKSQAFTLGAFWSHVHDMATFAYVGVADPKTTLGGVVIPVDVGVVWLEVQDLPACFEGPLESSPWDPVLSCEIDRLRVDITGAK